MQLRWCVVVAGLAVMSCKKKESAPASQPSTGVVAPRGEQGQMNAPPIVSANPPPPGEAPPLRAAVDAGATAATATVPAGNAAPLATADGGAAKAAKAKDSDENGGFGGGGITYGTIGHGSGTANPCGGGLSYGTIGRKSPPPPSQRPGLRLGTIQFEGNQDSDRELVRRYVRRNQSKLEYCYEKQLLVTPTLHGTLNLAFTIGPSGAVIAVKASDFPSPEVSSCVEGYVKGIEFPKPAKGTLIVTRYPITFVTSQ